jgi:hypothetical protein
MRGRRGSDVCNESGNAAAQKNKSKSDKETVLVMMGEGFHVRSL